MSLFEHILKFGKEKIEGKGRLLFTTPTHSQGEFIDKNSKKLLGKKVYECDYSEIEGFDNLRCPEGILKNLQTKLAEIYKSKATFILTNGSTSGILAAMLATLKENDKVIIARNCHISVYNGLVLTGAKPVWVMPKYNPAWDIYEEVTPESIQDAANENPDAKAVILTSPTYEGVLSNISAVSKIVKKAEMTLIVDEAHGALLNFGDFKSKPAILSGADISIQSLHKTAGALTPAALLHVADAVDEDKIQSALNLINTTSPSYPLMLSIENTVNFLDSDKGRNYIKSLLKNIEKHSDILQKDSLFKIYRNNNDPTKILFKKESVNAQKIAEYLNKKGIEEEFSNNKSLLFITGVGTTDKKLRKLFTALNKLNSFPEARGTDISCVIPAVADMTVQQTALTPKEAYYKESVTVSIQEAIGEIAAEPVLKYPPGIPLILPGECINNELIPFINKDFIRIIKKC